MKNKSIIMFVVAVLIIIAGFFLFNSFLKKNVIEQDTSGQQKKIESKKDASLVVSQQAGGTNIFIEKAFLLKDGYVVIHRENNGNPGEIIGVSKLLKSGENDNFLMDIKKKVVKGDILFAMLHTDDGDGEFDSKLDVLVTDNNSNPIFVKFNIVGEGALDPEIKL